MIHRVRIVLRSLMVLALVAACSSSSDGAASAGSVGEACNPNATGTDGCDGQSICITQKDVCYADCSMVSCVNGTCESYQSQLSGEVTVCVPDGSSLPDSSSSPEGDDAGSGFSDGGSGATSPPVQDRCNLIGTWSRSLLTGVGCDGVAYASATEPSISISAADVSGRTFVESNNVQSETCVIDEDTCTMTCTVTAFPSDSCLVGTQGHYNFNTLVETAACTLNNCACVSQCDVSLSKE